MRSSSHSSDGHPGHEPERRGGGWVLGQFALMAVVLVAGLVPPGWPGALEPGLKVIGGLLCAAGIAVAVWAGTTMGKALTPFPKPIPAGLVTTGPFAVVRHPIYTGGLLLFVGYALITSVSALVLALALGVLWACKSRVEERHLENVYEGYAAYRHRVRSRLLPRIY